MTQCVLPTQSITDTFLSNELNGNCVKSSYWKVLVIVVEFTVGGNCCKWIRHYVEFELYFSLKTLSS